MDLSVFLPHTEEVSAQLPPARLCKFDPVNVAANVFDSEAMGREMCHPSSSPQIRPQPPRDHLMRYIHTEKQQPVSCISSVLRSLLVQARCQSVSAVNSSKTLAGFPVLRKFRNGLSRSVARSVAPWHSWFQVGRCFRRMHLSKSAN